MGGDKELCKSAKCVEQECRNHEHCADFFQDTGLEGYKCIKQKCVNVECTNVGHCESHQLCDKATNTCYAPECIGHASCEANVPAKCGDGKCLCTGNECVKQECRTNDHCGWPAAARLCRDNECVDVGCTSHAHCKNLAEGGPTSYCEKNSCIHGAECLVTSDCQLTCQLTARTRNVSRWTATETLTARITTFASTRTARASSAEPAKTAALVRSVSTASALPN